MNTQIDSATVPAIELVGVTKQYRDQTAVDDLTLRIPRGTILGLLGPNGAGKSTTIKMLMGMLRPTGGDVRVLGLDVFSHPSEVKARVGYVPEAHQIYRWMRVGEVIGFCRAFYPTWDERSCAALLDQFALDPRKKVRHLSKGMLAKLSLLLALAHDPDVLILDEPTSGLDPIAREEFLDGILPALCEKERTILFSSHSFSDVQRLADSVAIIAHGRLLVNRSIDDLLASTKRIRAVLNDGCLPQVPPDGTIWERVQRREWLLTVHDFSPDVVAQLRESNSVGHVDITDLSLEEVFKDFVRGRSAAA